MVEVYHLPVRELSRPPHCYKLPENVVCLLHLLHIYSNARQISFITEANAMNLREQSDLGLYCLQYKPSKLQFKPP